MIFGLSLGQVIIIIIGTLPLGIASAWIGWECYGYHCWKEAGKPGEYRKWRAKQKIEWFLCKK